MASDGSIKIDTSIDTTKLIAQLGALKGMLKGTFNAAAFGKALSSFGSTLTKKMTLPIIAIGTAITKVGLDFEKSFAKVTTMITDASVNLEGLRHNVIDLSNDTAVASKEINEGLYQALSAGVEITGDGSDALGFMTDALKLARSGFTDTSTAVDALTTVLNAYGMSQSEVARISDILISTQNEGKTTVNELAGSLAQVIPTAAALGLSVEQVGAAFATMTAQGTPTAMAATQIRGLLDELSKSGTVASDTFKQISGQSFPEFIAAGGTLTDGLMMMQSYASANNLTMKDLFGNIRAGNGALQLVSSSGAVKFNQSLGVLENSAGAVDIAYTKMTDTLGFKMERAFNKFRNAGVKAFDSVSPIVEDLADSLERLADWIQSLPAGVLENATKFAAFLAIAGPVLVVVGKLITAVKLLSAALSISAGPIGLVVAGLSALALLIIGLSSSVDDHVNKQTLYNETYQESKEKIENFNSALEKLDFRTPAEKAEQLEEALTDINDIDPTIDIELNGADAAAETQALRDAMTDIVVQSDDLEEALGTLQGAFDGWEETMLNARKSAISNFIFTMAASGISAIEFASVLNGVRDNFAEYEAGVGETADAMMEFWTTMSEGGEISEETAARMLDSIQGVNEVTPELTNNITSAKEAYALLMEAQQNGTLAIDENNVLLQQSADLLISELEPNIKQVSAAYEAYKINQENLITAHAAGLEANQATIESNYEMIGAIQKAGDAWSETGDMQAMYTELSKNLNAEQLASVIATAEEISVTEELKWIDILLAQDVYQKEAQDLFEVNKDAMLAIQAAMNDEMNVDTSEFSEEQMQIYNDLSTAKEENASSLKDSLGEIEGSMNADQLAALVEMFDEMGIEVDDSTLELITKFATLNEV